MLNAALYGGVVAFGLILLAGILGASIVFNQGKTTRRSLQFALLVVMSGLLIPGMLGTATFVAYRSTTAFMDNAERADGAVVRIVESRMSEGGYGYAAVIQFATSTGRVLEFKDGEEVCRTPCKSVGDRVKVLYNADDPTEARVDTFSSRQTAMGVLGLLTGVSLLIAFIAIRHAYRHDLSSILARGIFKRASVKTPA